MKLSYAALAAIILASGTAVGFATGTRMAPESSEADQQSSVEIAALIEEQERNSDLISKRELALEERSADLISDQEKISKQIEELTSREKLANQRETDLNARTEQLEEKVASLKALEEDLTRMHESVRAESESLRIDSETLEEQRTELNKQEEVISAKLRLISERESQLTALEEELSVQSAALRAQELALNTDTKLDLDGGQLISRTASSPALSGVELSRVALQEPTSTEEILEEGGQSEQVSDASVIGSSPVVPSNGPIAEVHFERNSANLTPGAIKRAREAADRLQNTKFSKIRIAGHTDTTGSPTRNRALSNERAEAVADIFVQSGFPREMIEIVAFGETFDMLPVSTGDGISEPLNRCVGIFVEEFEQSSLE